jgi:hypothetical protein
MRVAVQFGIVNMKRKEVQGPNGQREVDPLVWLKNELLRDREGIELSDDDLKELDELALVLSRQGAPREARFDNQAIEALVDMLPSESLTEAFLDGVNQRRRFLAPFKSPADVLRGVRELAGKSIAEAAAAFQAPTEVLLKVEQGAAPWYRLSPEGLARFAKLVGRPSADILSALKQGAWRSLLRQIEGRLSLSLGRYDMLQSAPKARLDAIKATLAMVRDENHGAMDFFRKAGRLQ